MRTKKVRSRFLGAPPERLGKCWVKIDILEAKQTKNRVDPSKLGKKEAAPAGNQNGKNKKVKPCSLLGGYKKTETNSSPRTYER